MLFPDKPWAETLMNTGCSGFGQDRTSLSRCFQVLPSHFSRDHPFDPILIPSQTIIQPESSTSQQYGVIIHMSLWHCEPERQEKTGMYCFWCSLYTSLPILSVCLFWFEGAVEGYSTERVLHTSIGLKIDLAGFLRHPRRILALHTTLLPPPPFQPTVPHFTAGTTCMLIRHGTILPPHTCIITCTDVTPAEAWLPSRAAWVGPALELCRVCCPLKSKAWREAG